MELFRPTVLLVLVLVLVLGIMVTGTEGRGSKACRRRAGQCVADTEVVTQNTKSILSCG